MNVLVLPGRITPLRAERHGNWLIVVRQQSELERYGAWEPMTTSFGHPKGRRGYRIVCTDRAEALRCLSAIGPQLIPGVQRSAMINDRGFIAWLLLHHVRLQGDYTLAHRREVMFSELMHGWRPTSDEFDGGVASPLCRERDLAPMPGGPGVMIDALLASAQDA